MSDLGIMDYFLTKNEMKVESDMDMSSNYDNSDLMSSDFFDSILSMEKPNIDGCDLDAGLFDNLEMDVNIASDESITYDDVQCETTTFSDSGLSSDLQEMPDQILSDDELLKTILDTAVPSDLQSVHPHLVTQSQPIVVPVTPVECVRPFIAPSFAPSHVETEKPKIINVIKPVQKSKQVIRVQPMNGNARSVLLPINIKDLKTIKIINTGNLKAENIKFATAPVRPNKKNNPTEKYIIKPARKCEDQIASVAPTIRCHKQSSQSSIVTMSTEEEHSVDDSSSQYPPLLLTPEEKRLLNKDGIQLPCRYPLTKHEERELKRIRRKIRNKISAQDSRKRKKEYVDGLEERVKQCSEENRSLLKRIKLLQLQNNKLSSQLSKLQALVFKTGTSRAHPATCLMIVLLSVMLVTLPNLRNNSGNSAVDKELNTLQQYVARRALLFSQQATNEDTAALNMDEFITFNKKNNEDDEEIVEMINGKKESIVSVSNFKSDEFDNEFFVDDSGGGEPNDGNVLKIGLKRYIEPDIDDTWPPAKKRNVSVAEHTQLNRTEYLE